MGRVPQYVCFILSASLITLLCVYIFCTKGYASAFGLRLERSRRLALSISKRNPHNELKHAKTAIAAVKNRSSKTCHTAYKDPDSDFRSAFKVVGYEHTLVQNCSLAECDLNKNHTPVNVLSCDEQTDKRVTEKVTLVVKTTQRLTETTRLIQSLQRYYPELNAVVIDDTANLSFTKNSEAIHKEQRLWEKFVSKSNGLIRYTKLSGNAGISKGRNVGLQQVKTKYFLLLDDDVIATNKSDLSKMVDILDRTDLSIVGGELQQQKGKVIQFSGIVRVQQQPNTKHIQLYEYRNTAYEEIPSFPSCFAVDYVLNVFLAKTDQIIKSGGWDENLPIGEHRDFLLNLKKRGYKLAYCKGILFKHQPPNQVLHRHTWASQKIISHPYYRVKWNLPWKEILNCNVALYNDYKCK